MAPLVSVILASYNQAPYLQEAVESVFRQTHPAWELVIIDNGSTDGSQDLLRRYAGHGQIRLLLRDRNEAVTRRLNEAISASTGSYLSILYSDDYYLPSKLERQMACLDPLPADFGVTYGPGYRLYQYTGQQTLDPSLKASGHVLKDLLVGRTRGLVAISPLFRRACWERYPFDEDLFIEGELCYLRYAMKYRFQYLDEPLVVMRDHGENEGKNIRINVERMLILLDKLERHPDFPPDHAPYARTYRAELLRDLGWHELRFHGDRPLCRRALLQALRTQPAQALSPRTIAAALLSLLPGPVWQPLRSLADATAHLRRTPARIPPTSDSSPSREA